MRLQFDSDQEHQREAVQAIVDLLEGQPYVPAELTTTVDHTGALFATVSNRIDLTAVAQLKNLIRVQERHQLDKDDSLRLISDQVETLAGTTQVAFPNFSIEMETGTGKTYVYIRAALRLAQLYGLRKFVVVVPSVAVREGVMKTFEMTAAHFAELFDNLPYRAFAYRSDRLGEIFQFAQSTSVEFMVLTLDSFNKDSNVLRSRPDRANGRVPLFAIQQARPLLLLDEPQNMETKLAKWALSSLDPVLTLRFSATHRQRYNTAFQLTPFDAYRAGLVKRISVVPLLEQGQTGQPFVRLESFKATKRTTSAKLRIHQRQTSGTVKEALVPVRLGDRLYDKSGGLIEYDGFTVAEIDSGSEFLQFGNGLELGLNQEIGAIREAIIEAQIRYTVEEHLRKQQRLLNRGLKIKVLSLFFLQHVRDYAPQDGWIREAFETAFDDLRGRYEAFAAKEASAVHGGYFARKKERGGVVVDIDSTEDRVSKADEDVYALIMRDKERLLSFDTDLSFIFSHSALREGWDNPNVFQVCTLAQSASVTKKRQEIGRGIRLAVSADGERVLDDTVNVLTVVANESYENFAVALQREWEEAGGVGRIPTRNAKDSTPIRRRESVFESAAFEELWKRISQRSRYWVDLDTDSLVKDSAVALASAEIAPPRIVAEKLEVDVTEDDRVVMIRKALPVGVAGVTRDRPLPDAISLVEHALACNRPSLRLTRQTIVEVIKRSGRVADLVASPEEFAAATASILTTHIGKSLVAGIRYELTGDRYGLELLADEFEAAKDRALAVSSNRSLYDHVVFDSDVERQFIEQLEVTEQIQLYLKLPTRFTVATPIGQYNPDWALVVEERNEFGDASGSSLYLVRETKGVLNTAVLRPREHQKVACGARHFAEASVDYKVVTNVTELI